MNPVPFSASGVSFGIHEWCGSGPATLHVHHSDDEAWHVLDGELTFRYADRTETVGPGHTVFVPAGTAPHVHGRRESSLSGRANAATERFDRRAPVQS